MKRIIVKGFNAAGELYHHEERPEKYISYDNLLPSLFAREFRNGGTITKRIIERL
jgi:hypothetical protein